MTTLKIRPEDLRAARQLLRAALRAANLPAEVAEGSAVDELIIGPAAMAMAVLRADAAAHDLARSRQGILQIPDAAERAQSAQVFANNLFLSPQPGAPARGVVRVEFSRSTSGVVPVGATFTAPRGQQFRYDGAIALLYSASDLRVETDAQGTLRYVLYVPVVAALPGVEGNLDSVVFSGWTPFSPYIQAVRTAGPLTGGAAAESPEALLARLPQAITTRNLISQQSLMAQLAIEFPTLQGVVVVRAGEPEMVRDRTLFPGLGPAVSHGGCVDIYTHFASSTRTIEVPVGEAWGQATGEWTAFRDLAADLEGYPLFQNVRPGDVLRITDPQADEATTYVIEHADASRLDVSGLVPFTRLTPQPLASGVLFDATFDAATRTFALDADETLVTADMVGAWLYVSEHGTNVVLLSRVQAVSGLVRGRYYTHVKVTDPDGGLAALGAGDLQVRVFDRRLRYSIGRNADRWDDVVPQRDFGQVVGASTRQGAVVIHGLPVGHIREVLLLNPTLPDADPVRGGVLLDTRVNRQPARDAGEYQVQSLRPYFGASARDATAIYVMPADPRGGADGSITLDDAGEQTATFYAESAAFTLDDVGLHLRLSGSVQRDMNGWWHITALEDENTVRVTRLGAHGETPDLAGDDGLTWAVDTRTAVEGVLRVTFDTTPEVAAVDARLMAPDTRVAASRPLARQFHPVRLSVVLRYSLSRLAATTPFDPDEAARRLSLFINGFPAGEALHANDLVTELRRTWPAVGNVLPPELTYELAAPSGDLVRFSSTDEVALTSSYCVTAADVAALEAAQRLGLSARTARISTSPDRILLEAL